MNPKPPRACLVAVSWVLFAAAGLSACAGLPPTTSVAFLSPPPSSQASSPSPALPSAVPSDTPVASSESSPLATSDMDERALHAVPDLEAELPLSVAGIALERFSFAGSSGPAGDVFLAAQLEIIGRSAAELEMAIAMSTDGDGQLIIVAYRLPGMSGTDLQGLVDPDDIDGTIEEVQRGDRSVLELTEDEVSYAMGTDAALFIVGGDPDLVEAALDGLK